MVGTPWLPALLPFLALHAIVLLCITAYPQSCSHDPTVSADWSCCPWGAPTWWMVGTPWLPALPSPPASPLQIVMPLHHPPPPQPPACCWEGSHRQWWREAHRHCDLLYVAWGWKSCGRGKGGNVEVEVAEVAGVAHCHLQRQSRVIVWLALSSGVLFLYVHFTVIQAM
jgi:hypothetical protein